MTKNVMQQNEECKRKTSVIVMDCHDYIVVEELKAQEMNHPLLQFRRLESRDLQLRNVVSSISKSESYRLKAFLLRYTM